MVDTIIKGGLALAAVAVAYFFADKEVEKQTGKHIHEHVLKRFDDLVLFCRSWLEQHKECKRVYLNLKFLYDSIKCAVKRGKNKVDFWLWGEIENDRPTLISEEEITLEEAQGLCRRYSKFNELTIAE